MSCGAVWSIKGNIQMINIMINLGLAVVLFVINGVLGRIQYMLRGNLFEYGEFCFSNSQLQNFSGNFFLKVINPTIFVSICCAVAQYTGNPTYCHSTWMIPVFYWCIRIIFILLKQCYDITNWKVEFIAFVVSMAFTIVVLEWMVFPLLDSGESVFIEPSALRDALWYGIIAYVVLAIWKIAKLSLVGDKLFPSTKIGQIVLRRYNLLQARFGDVVMKNINKYYPEDKDGKGEFACLVYAIMIYEDYNRPFVVRVVEILKKRLSELFGNYEMMTLGVMQVQTCSIISDETSIEFAVRKLLRSYLEDFEHGGIECAINDYNGSNQYRLEVTGIYRILYELVPCDSMIDRNKVNI